MRLRYYVSILSMRIRTSLVQSLQYRWQFLGEAVMSMFWASVSLLPLWVFGGTNRVVEGWSYPEMIVVTGWFILLKGLIDGAINPSLIAVVEQIRDGKLDFTLIKPADAQFLVSTSNFNLLRFVDVFAGVGLLSYAFHLLGRGPSMAQALAATLLLGSAAIVLYSFWILVVCVAFWAVRLDNLPYLFMSIFDFARWPVSLFRGALRLVFTFVIPLAIMTTYPSMALLGKMAPSHAAGPFAGALVFAVLARAVWKKAIGHYTSASS